MNIYTTTHTHNILGKFGILCWATFITILGYMQPTGHKLAIPASAIWEKLEKHIVSLNYLHDQKCPHVFAQILTGGPLGNSNQREMNVYHQHTL